MGTCHFQPGLRTSVLSQTMPFLTDMINRCFEHPSGTVGQDAAVIGLETRQLFAARFIHCQIRSLGKTEHVGMK